MASKKVHGHLKDMGRNSFKMVKKGAGAGLGAGMQMGKMGHKMGKMGAGLGVGLGKGLLTGAKGLATGDMSLLDAKLAAMHEQMELSVGQIVKGLIALCGLQLVFTLSSACLAVTSDEPRAAKIQNGMIAFVSFFVSFLGIYGAGKRNKQCLVMFVTVELWGLSSITTYLFASVKVRQGGRTDGPTDGPTHGLVLLSRGSIYARLTPLLVAPPTPPLASLLVANNDTYLSLLFASVKSHAAGTLMCKDFNLAQKASVQAVAVGAAHVVDCDAATGTFAAIVVLCLLSLATILLGAYFGLRLSETIEKPYKGEVG